MKHYHYEIQAFNGKIPEVGEKKVTKDKYRFADFAVVDVIEQSEKNALVKAKTMLKKKFYRIGKVYECHYSTTDFELEDRMRMAQLEVQAKAMKLLSPLGK